MTRHKSARGAVAEPIGKRAATRTHGEWEARARGSILDAQRYTRFVSIMKRALLIGAALVLLAVIGYSVVPRGSDQLAMTFDRVGTVDNDLAMIRPKLTGADSKGNPFVVTADSAVQLGKNSRRAMLNNIEADMTMQNGGWLNANATRGLLDANRKTIKLTGDIAVFSDQGYEMHTDLADVDLDKGIVQGNHRVTGQGPLGSMQADHFRIERDSKHVMLIGNVHMTLEMAAAKKGKKKS